MPGDPIVSSTTNQGEAGTVTVGLADRDPVVVLNAPLSTTTLRRAEWFQTVVEAPFGQIERGVACTPSVVTVLSVAPPVPLGGGIAEPVPPAPSGGEGTLRAARTSATVPVLTGVTKCQSRRTPLRS